MTAITEDQMTETALTAAADMAEKLGMHQENDITMLSDQPILIASSKGIQMGILKIKHGEMRTYQYTDYLLNGDLLAREQYAITEQGWSNTATTETYLDEDATIYAGY